MKQIILMSFNNAIEGINFMNTFNYPCAFSVNRDWDSWYDKNGNVLENIPEQLLSNIMLPITDKFTYALTQNWIDDEYCYDGNFIFITRNKNV